MRTTADVFKHGLFKGHHVEQVDVLVRDNRSLLQAGRGHRLCGVRCQESDGTGFVSPKHKSNKSSLTKTQAILTPVTDPTFTAKKVNQFDSAYDTLANLEMHYQGKFITKFEQNLITVMWLL